MEVQETFHVIVVGLNFPSWVTNLKVVMILDLEKVVMPLSLVLFLARKRKVFYEGFYMPRDGHCLFTCLFHILICLTYLQSFEKVTISVREVFLIGFLLVIVLSCPQIDSLSSSTANQRAAQNNYWAFECQDMYFLNFVTCNIKKLY